MARDIIVIGASRGGIRALCRLVGQLPADIAASIFIVQHIAPESPGLLAGILSRCTPLPVSYACQGQHVVPGHVTLAPADHHLALEPPGIIGLDRGPKVRHARPAADRLFISAASTYGPRVIGIVLTGGDGDGADGLVAIKSAGGLRIVQDPAEAEDPSMPRSALSKDTPEFCLPLDQIGPILLQLTA